MKNFFDIKDEKITDKAFTHSVVISIVGILICIVALCSATFAWFSGGTSSSGNNISSGSFGLSVSVTKTENGVATAESIEVTRNGEYFTCDLAAGTYTVTLTREGGSTSNGYCFVTLGSAEAQPTATIVDAELAENDTNPFVFTIEIDEPMKVKFMPRWGIHLNPIIENGSTVSPVVEAETTANE